MDQQEAIENIRVRLEDAISDEMDALQEMIYAGPEIEDMERCRPALAKAKLQVAILTANLAVAMNSGLRSDN